MRQKGYSAINIIGLSLGLAATILILIYIVDEFSYDRMHTDAGQIYRVGVSARLEGTGIMSAETCAPLAERMQKEIPQVTEVVRFGMWETMPMAFDDKTFTEKRVLVADSNFFRFFSFPVIKGNIEDFLRGPDKLVITESTALRYFGTEDPIGKIITRGAERTAAEVVGLVKDPPHNSHITFNMVLSGESWDFMDDTQWTSMNLYTYFKTHPNADLSVVKDHLDDMVETHMGSELERFTGLNLQEFRKQGNDLGLFIQPMLDIHLRSDLKGEITPGGNIKYLYIFGIIALFIILAACINFMNLSTARSANRAKEVGIRKTVGAFRSRLIFQFIAESLLYTFVSTLLALAIISLSLNSFNELTGKELTISIFGSPVVIGSLLLFVMVVGVIAGSYPAFYLASFNPTDVLKGKVRSGFKNSMLRNTLVVFQFVISIALIFGSIVVYRQLQFIQKKELGFDKENVINLLHTLLLKTDAEAFKNELSMHPTFRGATYANSLPPRTPWWSAFRKAGSDQDFMLNVYEADYDHLKTMGYEMKAGRYFSREFRSDKDGIILNETAYKAMAFTNLEEAVVLSYRSEPPAPLKVLGVLKDFNYQSLKDDVKPMAILLGPEPNLEMGIRLSKGNTAEQLKLLENIWKKYAPDAPFEYSFLDQNFDALFRTEQRMGRIILVFTVLAISIACLGLFGLAAYTAEQRAKEISIRKVMGASVTQMVALIAKDFTILVMVALAIATPLAWYLAEGWLAGFANRIRIEYTYAVISGLISMLIAMVTISYQSLKAARENPVKAMRLE